MFLKAGAFSLALLLASRLMGLLRESAQAAAFGTSALADVAVLMLTLPDWLTAVVASGALAYALVPAWAGHSTVQVDRSQRRIAAWLLVASALTALAMALLRQPLLEALAPGVPMTLQSSARQALVWSAVAFPAALLAALWGTRLQHERDFVGLYGANLVVNSLLITALVWSGLQASEAVWRLGLGLLIAMGLRLLWQTWRMAGRASEAPAANEASVQLPRSSTWAWAALSAGLPLALPFLARSLASRAGEGELATFNYAWKLVELPLVLAIQLVATLAFPAIAAGLKSPAPGSDARIALRSAMALAWTLACAAAAALLVGAPAAAQLLFGWGRMDPTALARVAQWGALASWGLLPQALTAVALTALAALGRMRAAAFAYGAALAVLLACAPLGLGGHALMGLLNLLFLGVAFAVIAALGPQRWGWLPWPSLLGAGLPLLAWALAAYWLVVPGVVAGLVLALLAAATVMACAWFCGVDLRHALRR